MSGVAVLTVSTVIVKVIGLLYKIPMIKYLGEDGMGYFNSAYEIYTLFYIIATAGLPVAISIMVAKNSEKGNTENVKRIFGVSMTVLSLLGVIGTLTIFFGARTFGDIIENSGAVASIAAIAPMAIFICISSAIRGYFQGKGNMTPTAVSQIIEALGKLVPGLWLGIRAVKMGYSITTAAAYATFGITVGVGLSMLYLVFAKLFCRENAVEWAAFQTVERKRDIVGELTKIAVPITLSSAVISMTRIIDLVMILRRLQNIGYTEEAANAIYGSYSTLAVSMFNLPASLVTPVALSLVPVLTATVSAGNKSGERATLNSSLKLCGLMMIPASLGLSVFSHPILSLVFSGETGAVNIAAPLLSVLAVSVFFSCLMTVTNAVLQAYGMERKPIVSMTVGAAVKMVLSYILIGIPQINIYGAPISTLACDVAVSAINIAYIKKATDCVDSSARLFGGTLLSGVLSVGGVGLAYYGLLRREVITRSGISTLITIALAAVLYAVLILRFNVIRREEISLLPKGDKLYLIMKKMKLVK